MVDGPCVAPARMAPDLAPRDAVCRAPNVDAEGPVVRQEPTTRAAGDAVDVSDEPNASANPDPALGVHWKGGPIKVLGGRTYYAAYETPRGMIKLHDFVYVLPEGGAPCERYIACVEALFENRVQEKLALVRWFYLPVEVGATASTMEYGPREVFLSSQGDLQALPVECIDGLVTVVCPQDFHTHRDAIDGEDREHVFVCTRRFDMRTKLYAPCDLSRKQGYSQQPWLREQTAAKERAARLKPSTRPDALASAAHAVPARQPQAQAAPTAREVAGGAHAPTGQDDVAIPADSARPISPIGTPQVEAAVPADGGLSSPPPSASETTDAPMEDVLDVGYSSGAAEGKGGVSSRPPASPHGDDGGFHGASDRDEQRLPEPAHPPPPPAAERVQAYDADDEARGTAAEAKGRRQQRVRAAPSPHAMETDDAEVRCRPVEQPCSAPIRIQRPRRGVSQSSRQRGFYAGDSDSDEQKERHGPVLRSLSHTRSLPVGMEMVEHVGTYYANCTPADRAARQQGCDVCELPLRRAPARCPCGRLAHKKCLGPDDVPFECSRCRRGFQVDATFAALDLRHMTTEDQNEGSLEGGFANRSKIDHALDALPPWFEPALVADLELSDDPEPLGAHPTDREPTEGIDPLTAAMQAHVMGTAEPSSRLPSETEGRQPQATSKEAGPSREVGPSSLAVTDARSSPDSSRSTYALPPFTSAPGSPQARAREALETSSVSFGERPEPSRLSPQPPSTLSPHRRLLDQGASRWGSEVSPLSSRTVGQRRFAVEGAREMPLGKQVLSRSASAIPTFLRNPSLQVDIPAQSSPVHLPLLGPPALLRTTLKRSFSLTQDGTASDDSSPAGSPRLSLKDLKAAKRQQAANMSVEPQRDSRPPQSSF